MWIIRALRAVAYVLACFGVSTLTTVADARELSPSDRLLVLQYEYDHAEAMGEAYGLTMACRNDREADNLRKLNVLKGGFSTFAATKGVLTDMEQRQALANWEIGRANVARVGCGNEGVLRLRRVIARLTDDYGKQMDVLLRLPAKAP